MSKASGDFPASHWLEVLKTTEMADCQWKKAVNALAALGLRAAPALIDASGSEHPEVRLGASKALHKIGPAVVPFLMKALRHENSLVREGAARGLYGFAPKAQQAIPALTDALQDSDAIVRQWAATALQSLAHYLGPILKVVVPGLVERLKDEDFMVRFWAAQALSSIGAAAESAIPALQSALDDEDSSVKEAVATAIRDIRGEKPAMIADWDTNVLFVSDLLEQREPALFASLRAALNGIPNKIIPGTKDIWCRDFMPVQLGENTFCQFVYAPDYIRGYEESITPPEKCRLPFMKEYWQEQIVLDGGNVVASGSRVILTDKVFKENPSIEQNRLQERLEELFRAECVFIPTQEGDDVGHSDGVVRFVSENHVLMNDYSEVDPAYGKKVRSLLEGNGMEVDILPMFEEKSRRNGDDIESAVGSYVNYLRVGDVVVVPGYGRSEDVAALEKVRQVMPYATVSQVPCRSLARKGGVLNCVSWTILARRCCCL